MLLGGYSIAYSNLPCAQENCPKVFLNAKDQIDPCTTFGDEHADTVVKLDQYRMKQ